MPENKSHATVCGYKFAIIFVVSLIHVFHNKVLNCRGPRRISGDNTNDRYCDAVLAVAAPRFYSSTPVLLSECSDRSAPIMHLVSVQLRVLNAARYMWVAEYKLFVAYMLNPINKAGD